jgi:hypothetical protein
MRNSDLGGKVIGQPNALLQAHFAMDHIERLKRLTRHRPIGRTFQRRVHALERSALRMELEAKALSVSYWRACDPPHSVLTTDTLPFCHQMNPEATLALSAQAGLLTPWSTRA